MSVMGRIECEVSVVGRSGSVVSVVSKEWECNECCVLGVGV